MDPKEWSLLLGMTAKGFSQAVNQSIKTWELFYMKLIEKPMLGWFWMILDETWGKEVLKTPMKKPWSRPLKPMTWLTQAVEFFLPALVPCQATLALLYRCTNSPGNLFLSCRFEFCFITVCFYSLTWTGQLNLLLSASALGRGIFGAHVMYVTYV